MAVVIGSEGNGVSRMLLEAAGGKIIIPRGDDRLEAKDSVIVVTANQYLRDLSDILL